MNNAGIKNSTKVIIYTQQGSFSACRVWMTFKIFGHEDVFILNGGIENWMKNSGQIESGLLEPLDKNNKGYSANLNKTAVTDWRTVAKVSKGMEEGVIIDARGEGRFHGIEKEPREGLRSGHIPES